jgi:DNA-binding beta-propeller fold protein YncE
VAKFLLLAGLVVSPAAETMLIGAPVPPPAFLPDVVDKWSGLQKPSRIAVANDGRVYVSDSRRGVVAIFDPVGRRVGTLTGVDSPLGLAVSVLNRCGSFGCVCTPVERAYAGDEREGSVSVFEGGVFRRKLGIGGGDQKFLINFDTDVAFPYNGRLEFIAPEDSGDGKGYCYVTCHGKEHEPKEYDPNY